MKGRKPVPFCNYVAANTAEEDDQSLCVFSWLLTPEFCLSCSLLLFV